MKAKTVLRILRVLFVIFILLAILQFVFAAVKQIPSSMQVSLFALRLPIDVSNTELLLSLRWYVFICALPLYALCMFTVVKLISLLKPLANGQIFFTDKSFPAIRQIGYACWFYAGLSPFIEYAGAKLLPAIGQTEWEITFSPPVIPVIAGAVILLLAEACRQGFELKQDSDSIV